MSHLCLTDSFSSATSAALHWDVLAVPQMCLHCNIAGLQAQDSHFGELLKHVQCDTFISVTHSHGRCVLLTCGMCVIDMCDVCHDVCHALSSTTCAALQAHDNHIWRGARGTSWPGTRTSSYTQTTTRI